MPNDPRLASLAQRSVEESASLLEWRRRALFQIVEDLPDMIGAVREPTSDPADVPVDIAPESVTPGMEHPGWLQVQEVPYMNRSLARGASVPDR